MKHNHWRSKCTCRRRCGQYVIHTMYWLTLPWTRQSLANSESLAADWTTDKPILDGNYRQFCAKVPDIWKRGFGRVGHRNIRAWRWRIDLVWWGSQKWRQRQKRWGCFKNLWKSVSRKRIAFHSHFFSGQRALGWVLTLDGSWAGEANGEEGVWT